MDDQIFDAVEFHRIQSQLGVLLDGDRDDTTIVVVPSLTLHPDELKKVAGVHHFEERLLFYLQTLARPTARIVYVTSEPLSPAVVEYALDLVTSLPRRHARERLTLVDCADAGPTPLTSKILRSPAVLDEVRRSISDGKAYLATFVSTPLERALAMRLGVPLFACDPELAHLGGKSGARKLFRSAGVPVSPGVEDVADESGLVEGLEWLLRSHPDTRRAVVKLNDSFAGGGNAIFSYGGAPSSGLAAWLRAELPRRMSFTSPADSFDSYVAKLGEMGGVVEKFIDTPGTRSPSAQLEITPKGGPRLLATHDQVLGGNDSQVFVGASFPAPVPSRQRIQQLAVQAGEALAERGVLGLLSIDFVAEDVAAGGHCHALEINLRMGGTTAPLFLLRGLVRGEYLQATGEYVTREGSPRCYRSSDRIQSDAYRVLTADDVVDAALCAGVHYDAASRTGVAFYMLGALGDVGKLGMVAIEADPDRAQRLYDRSIAALDARAAAAGRGRRPLQV